MLAERALRTDARIDHDLRALREPLGAAYVVSYTASRLIASWLEGQGQTAGFARLLREQLSPGQLRAELGEPRALYPGSLRLGPMDARHVDVLLVGGGVASARCARTLRRQGFTGTILLVSDEETPPYNRPPLSKELLREDLPTELTLAEPMSWYERRGVELMLSTARGLHRSGGAHGRLSRTARRLRFGQLLLATGAEPRRPALPGAEHAFAAAHAAGRRSRCARRRWPGRRRW